MLGKIAQNGCAQSTPFVGKNLLAIFARGNLDIMVAKPFPFDSAGDKQLQWVQGNTGLKTESLSSQCYTGAVSCLNFICRADGEGCGSLLSHRDSVIMLGLLDDGRSQNAGRSEH